jgi:DNA-binding SARP family transcriptional activator
LAVGPGELDAGAFQGLVERGRRALGAGDPSRCGELLRSALVLWHGPPLAEVAFEDFAQAEIRRLEELRLEAIEARVEADLELGRHAQLVGELEGLLTEQPSRELVASQLMLAHYRCGRQADALGVYQRTRAHLAEELGLEPGRALKAMQTQILEQAPSLAPSDELGSHRLPSFPVGAAQPPVPPRRRSGGSKNWRRSVGCSHGQVIASLR